jgi:hypothetical protein
MDPMKLYYSMTIRESTFLNLQSISPKGCCNIHMGYFHYKTQDLNSKVLAFPVSAVHDAISNLLICRGYTDGLPAEINTQHAAYRCPGDVNAVLYSISLMTLVAWYH